MSETLFSVLEKLAGRAECLALTGAGGKTSLVAALTRLFREQGRNVLVSTTTRMYRPNVARLGPLVCDALLVAANLPVCQKNVPSSTPCNAAFTAEALVSELMHFFSGPPPRSLFLAESEDENSLQSPLGHDKLRGPDPARLCALWKRLRVSLAGSRFGLESEKIDELTAPLLVVEADGAAQRPLKFHADHEPRIPDCADLVIAVAGLDALGQPWRKAVHRPEAGLAALGLNSDEERPVTPEDMAGLLAWPHGPFREVNTPVAVFLNKSDTVEASVAEAVARAFTHLRPGVPIYAGSLQQGKAKRLG